MNEAGFTLRERESPTFLSNCFLHYNKGKTDASPNACLSYIFSTEYETLNSFLVGSSVTPQNPGVR